MALADRRPLHRRQTGCLLKRLPNNRLKPHIQPTWLVRSTAMRLDLSFGGLQGSPNYILCFSIAIASSFMCFFKAAGISHCRLSASIAA